MLIHADRVSFTYADGTAALDTISFGIRAGERVALTGRNGSGKSTLAKHLNGLLKPASGTLWIAGKITTAVNTVQLAHQVALLFQNPDDQICKPTIWEEVAFGPKNLGYSVDRVEALVGEALALFALTSNFTCNPHDSGYSERKRIAIASIVAMDTPVLVLDEPTAGLDPYEISLLIAALDILQSKNKTVVIISHDMDFIAENIARVITLSAGRKVFDGMSRELFRNRGFMATHGLHQPQLVQLSHASELPCVPLSAHECAVEIERQWRDCTENTASRRDGWRSRCDGT